MGDDLSALGIRVADGIAPSDEEVDVPVLPENWEALELFLACATQWRHVPMGGVTGLDYTALYSVMAMHQVAATEQRERLAQVQRIERGALQAMKDQQRG